MDPQELAQRLAALRTAGASNATIAAFLAKVGRPVPGMAPVSPGARFADPATPALTSTGEPVLPAPPRKTDVGEQYARGLATTLQGLTAGFSDEMGGLVRGGLNLLRGRSPVAGYREGKAAASGPVRAMQAEAPRDAAVAETIASLPLALTGGTAVAKAGGGLLRTPTMLQRATRLGKQAWEGAKAAGVAGAATSLGHAEGTPKEQATEVLKTGLASAALGGVVPVAAPTLTWPVKKLAEVTMLRRLLPGGSLPSRAVAKGAEAAEKDLTNVGKILRTRAGQQTEDLLRSAPTPKPSDFATAGGQLGEEFRRRVRAGIRADEATRRAAQHQLDQTRRAAQRAGKVLDDIILPGGRKSPTVKDPVIQDLIENGPPIFQQAFQQVRAEVKSLGRPMPARKVTVPFDVSSGQVTIGAARAAGVKLPPRLARLPDAATINPAFTLTRTVEQVTPTLESLDLLKEALDQEIQKVFSPGAATAARRPATATQAPGAKVLQAHLDQLYDRLRTILPEYGEAKDAYRGLKIEGRRTARLTGARAELDPTTGRKALVVPRTAEPEDVGSHIAARGLASAVAGNLKIGMVNTLAEMIRRTALGVSKKEAVEIARRALVTGPRADDFLTAMLQRSAGRQGRMVNRARAAGTGLGLTMGLLGPFRQPETP